MIKYICTVCGFIYNEESAVKDSSNNIVEFGDLPSDWLCPNCSVSKELFKAASTGEA